MNVVLWLVDGRAFVVFSLIGLGCFLGMTIAASGNRTTQSRWFRRVLWLVLCAVLLLPVTATPIPLPLLFAPGLLIVFGILVLARKAVSRGLLRICGVLGLCAVTLGLIVEWRWWSRPVVNVASADAGVVVIGDSLSAGIGAGEKTWPTLLAEQTGLKVVSVARPGARIADGVRQLGQAEVDGRMVVILLGGNDMLSAGPSALYAAELEELVLTVRERGGRPLLIEFPTTPFREGYGRVMRDIATVLDVPLLHRRHLAWVLQAPGATLDGLHLSESGHRHLALKIGEVLQK